MKARNKSLYGELIAMLAAEEVTIQRQGHHLVFTKSK